MTFADSKMQVVYSDDGLLHNPLNEVTGGVVKAYVGLYTFLKI